jgi:hypothetical protein
MSNAALTAVWKHSTSKGSARLVLLALADEAADSGSVTAYHRSQRWLAGKANITVEGVRKAVENLVANGELVILRPGSGRQPTDYRIVLPGLEPVEGDFVPSQDGDLWTNGRVVVRANLGVDPNGVGGSTSALAPNGTGGPDALAPNGGNGLQAVAPNGDPPPSSPCTDTPSNNTPSSSRAPQQRIHGLVEALEVSVDDASKAKTAKTEERFERFWQAYPKRDGKRVGKAKAKAIWMRMTPEEHLAAWKGVHHYAASGWIPKDAERWLRDRVWEDWQEPATPDQRGPVVESRLSDGKNDYPFNRGRAEYEREMAERANGAAK